MGYEGYEAPRKVIPEEAFIGSSEDYYFVAVICTNCGWSGKVFVQKRLPLYFAYCPDCECQRCLQFKEKCEIKKRRGPKLKE